MGILDGDVPAYGHATGLRVEKTKKGPDSMEEGMTTGDVVIGVLAATGVVVLIVVFIWVVRMVFMENTKDRDDV